MKLNKVESAQLTEKLSWVIVGIGLGIFTQFLGAQEYATAFFGLFITGLAYVSAVTNMKDGVVA